MNAHLSRPRHVTAIALVSAVVVTLVVGFDQPSARAQQAGQTESKIVQIPLVTGDSLQVRFTEPFKATDLAEGRVPRAEVAENKVISGVVMVAEGAPVTVAVVDGAVEGNGRAGKAGRFELVFESVEAVDGQAIPLEGALERKGSGRGIIVKILTLFLIKGENPRIDTREIFWTKFAEDTYVYAVQP